jgi:hypothetical protein
MAVSVIESIKTPGLSQQVSEYGRHHDLLTLNICAKAFGPYESFVYAGYNCNHQHQYQMHIFNISFEDVNLCCGETFRRLDSNPCFEYSSTGPDKFYPHVNLVAWPQ